jgi:hypothetical protein
MAATARLSDRIAEFLALSDLELVHRFRRGLEVLDPRLFELSDSQLDAAFLPEAGVGRWPVRVLLGHLADADLFFVQRMRRIVAEDRPVLEAWDEDAFIDAGLYGGPEGGGQHPVGGYLAVIHTLRKWAGTWLLTLMPEQFERKGMHPQRGEQSVKTILAYATWHLEHHADFCNRKVVKMLGPMPEQASAMGECCGGKGGAGGGCCGGAKASAHPGRPAVNGSGGCGCHGG